jgi:glyoxylase-like metal-dependent hydrolase (beta-lactamase superfamily II)
MTRPVPEQPEDWTEPGAFAVAPGVHRIPLPLPSGGLRAVNVYVMEDSTGLVLVDSGWAGPEGERALADGLRQLGHRLSDVARVLVTHAHHDHYTQSLALRERYRARVFLGRGEAPTVAAGMRRGELPMPQTAFLCRAGAAQLADEFDRFTRNLDAVDDSPWGEPDRWLDEGDDVAVGERTLQVRATPGHARGHVVLRDTTASALFAGDHVLPHITPSIGYELAPEPAPLRSYLASLRLVRGLPDALLLPAHGPVTASVHTRVDELLAHHEARFNAVLEQVKAGATTAYEVAAALPWTRRSKRIDQLEIEHAALAVLETAVHLDLLVETGELTVGERDGVRHYET